MSNPYYGPGPYEDKRVQWLSKMPAHVQHEIWMKALDRNRPEELRARIEDPQRDEWLDELNADQTLDGAAHTKLFAAEAINTFIDEE